MTKTFLLSFGVVMLCIGCNNKAEQQADKIPVADDSLILEQPDNPFPVENLAIINETGFAKYARVTLPQLNWNRFTNTKFWQQDPNNKTSFTPEKHFFDYYGQFLKYSPDSTKFIDLDSYNIAIKKDKNGQLIGKSQEPETEISLIDLKTKEKIRLVFLGPGNSVEEAAWLDNNNLILLGYLENDAASGTNAAIWQFNLATQEVKLYELSDPAIVKKLENYSATVRLKNVINR